MFPVVFLNYPSMFIMSTILHSCVCIKFAGDYWLSGSGSPTKGLSYCHKHITGATYFRIIVNLDHAKANVCKRCNKYVMQGYEVTAKRIEAHQLQKAKLSDLIPKSQ